MNKPVIDTVKGVPQQTLQCSTGMLEKGVEVEIPLGEAEIWASQKPPLFKISKALPPAKAK